MLRYVKGKIRRRTGGRRRQREAVRPAHAAITAGIYNTYLGKEKKEDLFNGVMLTDAVVHIISVVLISGAIILVGAIVLHPQGLAIKAPTQLILMANVATSIATPVGGLFILLLLWRDDVNEGYKKPTVLRICMTVSYVFVLVMTYFGMKSYIPQVIALFTGA